MKPRYQKVVPHSDSSFSYFHRIDDEFAFAWHMHREYELTLIVSGRGERFVGDHVGDYAPGDLVLIGPNLPHTWRSIGSGRRSNHAVVAQFDERFVGRGFFDAPEMRSVRNLLTRSAAGLRFIKPHRAQVVRKLTDLGDRDPAHRLLGLVEILLALAGDAKVQALGSDVLAARAQPRVHQQQRIERVCRYIHEHLDQPLTVGAIAKHMHMAPATLSRFFRRTTGRTVVRYINESRVGRACELLIDTDLSISEIGYRAGFDNLSYFNRRFLQSKGVTPRAFRKSYTDAAGAAGG